MLLLESANQLWQFIFRLSTLKDEAHEIYVLIGEKRRQFMCQKITERRFGVVVQL